ncbi:MAG TPA: NAD(P)/FAD-dependent oxidoreductase [Pirellulales bacterium]|nr:NAD(P)/FAD-dependent oxidoreductase [Pirellulales bacterium]
MAEHAKHKVVVVGGGFGGLYAARAMTNSALQVTLVDRRNFHLFQPLLYQVATGGLAPANIAAPLRNLLRQRARVLLAEVVDFDLAGRRVLLADGELPFDSLIVAAGSEFNYFGHDDWRSLAPGLKSIEDATDIRARLLTAFEMAERTTDAAERRRWLTFVIAGGGATGVELAGALADLARYTMRQDFRAIDPSEARIILVEGRERLLTTFPEDLSAHTADTLRGLGVTIRTGAMVADVRPHEVVIKQGDRLETLPTETVLWTAGVRTAGIAGRLAQAAGAETDRMGRIMVQPDLTIAGHPNLFVVGDMAHLAPPGGEPLPGVAPVAMQQGQYVAQVIERRITGDPPPPPFHYHDRGNMAVIGRSAAVADLHWTHVWGFPAWLAWLFIHLLYLAQFQNRLLVLIQWAWNYVTRSRSARLITGEGRSGSEAERGRHRDTGRASAVAASAETR